MSAQAILSMIAPAVPAAPQGSATGDAVAFEGLLATALDAGDAFEAEVETTVASDESEDAVLTQGIVAPPAPPPTQPLLIVVAEDATQPPAATRTVEPETLEPTPDPVAANDAEAPPVAPGPARAGPPAQPVAPTTTAPQVVVVDGDDAEALESTEGENAEEGRAVASAAVDDGLVAPAPTFPDRPHIFTHEGRNYEVPRLIPRAMWENRALDAATSAETAPTDQRAAPSDKAITPATPVLTTTETTARLAEAVVAPVTSGASDEPRDERSGEAPLAEPTAQNTPAAAATVREAASPAMSRTAIEATVQIAAQIQRRLEGRNTRFEIALTPDDLGRVDVRLDIDAEGRLSARLAFDNPAAAADLRGRADELRRQLEQFGFQLADDAFEFAERDSGSSAFDRGQQQDAREAQGRAFARAARMNLDTEAVALTPRWAASSLTPSGVDLKV